MMEVGFTETESTFEMPPKNWERVGRAISWGSSIIASAAVLPTIGKKRRVYTPIIPIGESTSIQSVAEAAPDALPAALQCSQTAKDRIERLWTLISNNGGEGQEETIITNGAEAWRLGHELENELMIHPLANFIAIPREKIRTVFQSDSWLYRTARIPTILWGFGGGMRRALSEERPPQWPRLESLIPRFAEEMRKDPNEIRRLIQAADWRGLVDCLYDIEA